MHEDDELIVDLGQRSARILEGFCAQHGLTKANERDHLAPACKCAAVEVAARFDVARLLDSSGFGDKLGWTGLGDVDLVFRWPNRGHTFVELKCGSDLSACVWDAVKLAAGVLHGNASSAYLLAGAPATAWEKPARGAELFTDGQWQTDGAEIREKYKDWWYAWQEETVPAHPKPEPPFSKVRPNRHLPGLVAEAFETTYLGAFPLTIRESRWELRLARVEPAGAATVWKCVSNPKGGS